MPSVQLAFGHLIQCNINEIIQRTTTCLLLASVAPGGHGKTMVPVPHGTIGVYLSLTLTFGIENSSHPFLTLISDHIPKKSYITWIIRELWNSQKPVFLCSGIRITWGKTTSRTSRICSLWRLRTRQRVARVSGHGPWLHNLCWESPPSSLWRSLKIRTWECWQCWRRAKHRGLKLHGLNSDTLREKKKHYK